MYVLFSFWDRYTSTTSFLAICTRVRIQHAYAIELRNASKPSTTNSQMIGPLPYP